MTFVVAVLMLIVVQLVRLLIAFCLVTLAVPPAVTFVVAVLVLIVVRLVRLLIAFCLVA